MRKKTGALIFRCASCGAVQPRWLGRCPICGEWNSIEEQLVRDVGVGGMASGGMDGTVADERRVPVPLEEVDAAGGKRLATGLSELDRVLGGGATLRSAILIGGEPGIGKSTLLLQAAGAIALREGAGSVLYVSGEESEAQIKGRAGRLQVASAPVSLLCTMRLDDVMAALEVSVPRFLVIDSIQTMAAQTAEGVSGPVTQLRYCALALISWVKAHDSVLVMTAHVTKEGMIAGPKLLEHMVDTVVTFERTGDDVRFLRTEKNRFGSVDELGVFAMTEKGLEEVGDPSALFVTRREGEMPAGVVCAVVAEGSRAFMVEVQALTVEAKGAMSRVYSERVESNKVARVAAVLEKRTGLRFSDQDIYINIAGGIRVKDSAADAALAAALYSARVNVPLDVLTAVVGELSLAGEIRPVHRLAQRVKAAQSMGYKKVYVPGDSTAAQTETDEGDVVIGVATLTDLIKEAFGRQ